MQETSRRRELREFLIARRAAVSPESVGLQPGTRRRTPGLRREELATVAAVGVTWYTWLEQGRDIRVSAETLERIAVALRLTPTDTVYLFSLAGVPRPETVQPSRQVELDPGVQRVLDVFHAPAVVVGPSWDVEAFNALADRIYRFGDHAGPFQRNQIWRFFMDPERRALYADWETFAEVAVGILRSDSARCVGDPYFESLIGALCEGSPKFKQLWSAQHTAPLNPARVRLVVPGVGEVTVMSVRLRLPNTDYLLLLLPPADEASERQIARLAQELETSREPAAAKTAGRSSSPRGSR